MNYGFVIDNTRCIGCHACSTACKSENEVPLGVHRTWVKVVEHGRYPDVRRSFQVTRCNHCENPPCVRICPVTAMYQRDDGIVEFDKDVCIGCKACIQACPYDAIHIDPDSGTAAKCHYCAHRIDVGLEPACAVVCPTHAIIAGDLDDPISEISRMVAQSKVTVRKPEQGTSPKVLYIDGDQIALHPTVLAERPRQLLHSDVAGDQGVSATDAGRELGETGDGTRIRHPGPQGVPGGGPVRSGGGTRADQMVQLAYNAGHVMPWHWPVPAYLVTKAIAAGVFMFLGLGWLLGLFPFEVPTLLVAGGVGIAATLVTTALLVLDLERPGRFLSILLRPQWRSWLTRGAFLLVAFSAVSSAWVGAELAGSMQLWTVPGWLRLGLEIATVPLAAGAAMYTAFLFAQAEGRDLWQSPLLPAHLLVQALVMGAGTMLLLAPMLELAPELGFAARAAFGLGLAVDLAMIVLGEFGIPHASEVAARAAHEITHGRYRNHYTWGALVLGHLVPLALLVPNLPLAGAAAAVCAAVGLFFYEYAFVMAPQRVPNS